MNYYIDFDNTLYNTPLLTKKILTSIVNLIKEKNSELNSEILYEECKSMYNKEKVNNVYELAKHFAQEYNLDISHVINNLDITILNSSNLVFEDVIPFLTKLKEKGHNIYMLTYCKDTLEYQSIKIAGSKLGKYFDGLYITSTPKYNLDLDYENGIFIDDNYDDLLGLYSKNAKQVIRLRRKENEHSKKDINNDNIKEYTNFNEISII